MATLNQKAAAYTRTAILRRFMDALAHAIPQRVDNAYAEQKLGLKGGDVRAFLQSVRVLGLVDPYGNVTDRARRTRAVSQRPAALTEALREAYPELTARWERRGGMDRGEIEDYFRTEYTLSPSSTGPAAKLFEDLMREFYRPEEVVSAPDVEPAPAGEPVAAPGPAVTGDNALRLAAVELLKSSLDIKIDSQWDEQRLNLVFDRMEKLLGKVLPSEPAGN